MKNATPYKGDNSNNLNTTACAEDSTLGDDMDDDLEALQDDCYVVKCKKLRKGNSFLVS